MLVALYNSFISFFLLYIKMSEIPDLTSYQKNMYYTTIIIYYTK